VDYLYTGNGGINQLYLGLSTVFFERLSLGVNFNYLFGSINLRRAVVFPLNQERSFTEVESRTLVNDFIIDMGIQYTQDLGEKFNLTLGVIFDNKSSVSAENQITKINTFPGTRYAINDSTIIDPRFVLEESSTKGNILIPTNLGAGFSIRYNDRMTLGFDYYEQDWSNSTFFTDNQPLTKSNSFHGGFEIIPDPEALRGYHKKISYRIGGHYQNLYLQINEEQLKDYGISFGVGLPLRNPKSSFNLAVEGGRRGTLENDLIRENYMFLSFSVTLHDFWFVKRKYD
jgi:hypothetical protein